MPQDLLSQLRDVHSPAETISIWPLAWGWWTVLAAILIGLAFFIFALLRYRKNRYRRLAIKQLDNIRQLQDQQTFLQALAELLKSVAMQSDAATGQLFGDAWQHYLQQAMPETAAYTLATARYQKHSKVDKEALLQASKQWIKAHK